jgi:hypothetical protein
MVGAVLGFRAGLGPWAHGRDHDPDGTIGGHLLESHYKDGVRCIEHLVKHVGNAA